MALRKSRRKIPPKRHATHSFLPLLEDLESRLAPAASIEPIYVLNPGGQSGTVPLTGGTFEPLGYSPSQIRAAYGINEIKFGGVAGNGAGQTIAIVDAYDDPAFVDSTAANFASSDLAKFDAQFGLPNPVFTKFNQDGGTTDLPGVDPAGPGNDNWEGEEALDIEWAHAIAPQAAIDIVECNSDAGSDLYIGVQTAATLPGVSVVSMSWGGSEFDGEQGNDSAFTTPAGHQGVTFVAAAGDWGSPGVYPAFSPNVLAVGGTTLVLNANNSYNSETAWSVGSDPWNPDIGTGGGVSQYEAEPSYQLGVQSTGFRSIPDVSFDADPDTGVAVYDSYNNTDGLGPWEVLGGTSLAAPSWAGLIAIANQGRAANGLGTLDGPSQTLPALYGLPSSDFHDITSGSNGGYSAGPGYDMVTGLGTPVANLLVPALAQYTGNTLGPAVLGGATEGYAYDQTITAAGGSGTWSYTYTVSSGAIPAGLAIAADAGGLTISGTATEPGSVSFTVIATDSASDVESQEYTLVVNPPPTFSTVAIPATSAGIAYDQTITVGGGTGALAMSAQIISSPLPSWLRITTGTDSVTISGKPTAAAEVTVEVTATDSNGAAITQDYTLTVNPPIALNTGTLPGALDETGYYETIGASGGTGPLAVIYSITSGQVPPGINFILGPGELIVGGTPTTTGIVQFTVVAFDTIGASASETCTVVVYPPLAIPLVSIPASTVGVAYDQTISGAGGPGPDKVTYAMVSGAIPKGLLLSSSANTLTIKGTPTAAGQATFNAMLTDAGGITVSKTYTLTINGAISLDATSMPASTVATPYSQTVAVNGGTGAKTLTYSVTAGAVPKGINFKIGSGQLTVSGTPTSSGTVTFKLTAKDAVGAAASATYVLTINPAITVGPAFLAQGTAGAGYSETVVAGGGTGNKTVSYSVESGAVPAGLNVVGGKGELLISGDPVASGQATLAVTAIDEAGAVSTEDLALVINPAISLNTSAEPPAVVGRAYTGGISATGGTGTKTISYHIVTGTIPAGLTFTSEADGLNIVGTPKVTGTVKFTVTATDAAKATTSETLTITVDPVVTLNPTALGEGTIGVGYSETISASGGYGDLTVTYAITSGSIPTGLVFTAGPSLVAITGKPTGSGTVAFAVTGTDSLGDVASLKYKLTINPAVGLSPLSVSASTVGVAFKQTINASGGTGVVSVSYVSVSGAIPHGLAFKVSGSSLAITGTPTAAGTVVFSVTGKDSLGATTTQTYTLTINPPLALSPAKLPAATVGEAYSQAIAQVPGSGTGTIKLVYSIVSTTTAGLVFSVVDGQLIVSGTPSKSGLLTFKVTATDSVGATVTETYTLTVDQAAAVLPSNSPSEKVVAKGIQVVKPTQ